MMVDEAGPVPQACFSLSAAISREETTQPRSAQKAFQGGDRSLIGPVPGISPRSGTMWVNLSAPTESKTPLTA
jgi:hypothetical protein